MTAALVGVLAVAVFLALSPPAISGSRIRAALAVPRDSLAGTVVSRPGRWFAGRTLPGRTRRAAPHVPMTVVVQQLAALLKGGRIPSRLWDELWTLYGGNSSPDTRMERNSGRGAGLAPASVSMLAAARSAAMRGSPVGAAIRTAGAGPGGRGTRKVGRGSLAGNDRRVWAELAACFDIAEASGCPLADVLTRFAAQLDAEDDAEAARQTALAGPRATVRLLTWLPVLGLGLGMLLGVDPLRSLLGTPLGTAALAAGLALTAAGRIWSARLVRSAAGSQR
ncbi:hypothetical protein [Arthrobacter sp. CG_A4]|uniref:hypothetical protein n=1 Tax=Arthrobacter sp. CG_A4 TaxID=3071706 RepID=UPI002DF8DCBD|nr:tight adherence protein B [Arthrobacter sp. CG_A4]